MEVASRSLADMVRFPPEHWFIEGQRQINFSLWDGKTSELGFRGCQAGCIFDAAINHQSWNREKLCMWRALGVNCDDRTAKNMCIMKLALGIQLGRSKPLTSRFTF